MSSAVSTRDVEALIGRTFGEFVVRELISSGGFGMVFRAEQPALAREAVIKVLHTRHRASEITTQRFLREAQLASRLDHPYAAHTYAFGAEPDGVLWIAMELVRGTPLDRLLEAHGPIALEQLVPLLERICEVVHTAHEQGIVHRDLKPANVMVLRRAGRFLPKLLDLGIAKHAGAAGAAGVSSPALSLPPSSSMSGAPGGADPSLAETQPETGTTDAGDDALAVSGRLTEHGTSMGSPLYMAPEQWTDAGTVDGATDQYALGVLAYEALTGRPPFAGATRMQIAMAHARHAPPPLGDGFPIALDAVIARALAKRSADRYPDVLALAAAFRAASGVASEPVTLPRLPEALRDQVLARAPQPLALAVAALDAARNAHQARDALWQVVRVAVRLVGVCALAAHAHVGTGAGAGLGASGNQSGVAGALRGLRRRALSDAEWLALARGLCAPFAALRDAHPIPELVALVTGEASALTALLALRAASEEHGGGNDDQVRELLVRALPLGAALLEEVGFFAHYPLVVPVPTDDGGVGGEAWMGARRGERAAVALRGPILAALQPALVDATGLAVLTLWPYVQRLAPAPGAAECLFFFEGQGRRGARLVALPDAFERDDEGLWHTLAGVVGDAPDADPTGATSGAEAAERCPFPGLAAFTRDDAGAFFGRERETEAAVNRLRAQPLLAVVGPSGAGKSSFVQAGVLPALPATWTAITVRPGAAPLASLAARLAAAGLGVDAGELRAAVMADPAALGVLLRARAAARGETVVVVVDQLEELFTLCDDGDERARYADALARAARAADDPVRVIVTLRDDFLLRAAALPALRARLGPAVQLLTTPADDDLRRILTEPVSRAGYEFDDPALPAAMVATLAGTPGALALLSFTAARLWELRDRRFRQLGAKAYASLGGVGGALAQHAEATLEAMPVDERRLVREVFRHLVTAAGTRAVLSRAELDQVLGGGAAATTVVEKLVAARLLVVAEVEHGGERVEVTHEALLDAWPRLVGWRREDAEGARLRDQLRAAARQWDERGRSPGLLWRGDALAEYRLWRARTPGALTAAEEAFAAASLADAARGRRRLRTVIAGGFAILVAGVVALLFLNARATGERARAEAAAAETTAANQKLHDNLMRQYENQGRRLVLDGDPLQGLAYLAQAASLGARGRAHDFLIAEAVRATDGELLETHHDGVVASVDFSPDGARVISAGLDHRARIWDAGTGAPVRTLALGASVARATFGGGGATVLTFDFDRTATLWDARTGARLRTLGPVGAVRCAQFAPDGARVLTVSVDGDVEIWAAPGGARLARGRGGAAAKTSCAWSPDGARVATGDGHGDAWVLDAGTGAPIAALHGHRDRITWIAFGPDGARVVTASRDQTAIEWDVAAARPLRTFAHRAAVNSATYSPDGRLIATASNDHTAVVWDADTGAKVVTLAGHAAGINQARFSPDGTVVVTISDDATARLWDAATGRPLARWLGHRDVIEDVAFDPTGARLATASDDGTAILWDAAPHDRVTWLVGHAGIVETAAFSADGGHVVTAGRDGTARVWDAATGHALLVLRGHQGEVRWAAWSPDGRQVVTAGEDHTVRTWDARTGDAVRVLVGHDRAVNQVAWSPDGATLASASDDGTVRAWSATTGAARWSIQAHHGYRVRSATFIRGGAAIVTTGEDNAVRFWDAATGRSIGEHVDPDMPDSVSFDRTEQRAASPINQRLKVWDPTSGRTLVELVGHVGQITAPVAAWSPDGALVVTGSLDGTARIWDAANGDLLAVLAHGTQVWSSGFSPDGTRVITSADDGTVAIHELPRADVGPAELEAVLRCRVPYGFDGDRLVPRVPARAACRGTAPLQ